MKIKGVFKFSTKWQRRVSFALLAAIVLAGAPVLTIAAQNESPALRAWVAQLLQEHPRLLAMQANADAAQAQGRAAQAPLHNPELELDAERAAANSFSVGLSQTLDWSGKRTARTELASQHVHAALAELDGARQALAAEALAALARYHGARAAVTLAEKRLELLQRFMQVAVRRFDAGDIGRADADLARLAFSQARIQQAHARTALLDAEQSVRALHAQTPSAWPALDIPLPALAVPQDAALEQLLLQTPELRAAQARLDAARGGVELAERERHADPTLGMRGGRDGSDALVGLSLTVPLGLRNPRRAEVDAARAQALAAEHQRNATYRQARARLSGDAARYRIVFDAWEEWARSGGVTLAERTALLNKVWESGEISASEYLVQLQETLDTETAAAELRGEVWTAWSEWLAGSGQMIAWLGLPSHAQK